MPPMPPQQQNERGENTRQAILQAARQRFLHYGFKKTTIDEIAADAGVGKGTVYLYFDNKDEILLTLILHVKQNISAQLAAIAQTIALPEEKLRRMILATVMTVYDACTATAHGSELVDDLRPHLAKHPKMWDAFRRESERHLELIAEVLREGNASGAFAVAHPDETTRLVLSAFMAYFPPYTCVTYPECRTRAQLEHGAHAMVSFLLDGIRR